MEKSIAEMIGTIHAFMPGSGGWRNIDGDDCNSNRCKYCDQLLATRWKLVSKGDWNAVKKWIAAGGKWMGGPRK